MVQRYCQPRQAAGGLHLLRGSPAMQRGRGKPLPALLLPALLLTALAAATPAPDRPSYIQCQDSSECEPGHCCVLGAERYSVPSCRPLHGEGESCRGRGHVPINATVGYPDHSQVQLTNVYWLFCPCAPGLACRRPSSTCQAPAPPDQLLVR